jgi:benzaldehyde dehydrogenase (NAD)
MTALLEPTTWAGRVFSDGWKEADGGVAEIREPATGDLLTEVGVASPSDIARACERAAVAQLDWSRDWSARAAVLRRAAALLEANVDPFADWLIRETGSIRPKAEFEVQLAIGELHEAAALPSRPFGELLPSAQPGKTIMARRIPLGVVGAISPWNFPFVLSMRTVAPALALGNAVVLKPDVQTPITGGHAIARLFEEAGLPEGVLHVLPGGAEPGEALVQDHRVDMVSFTGSSEVGRRVGELAGRGLKRVQLELGGNSALIVLDDADLECASSNGAWGSFLHQGQICMATSRHLVHESIADEYVERLAARADALPVGNPYTDQVALGPMINERQLARVDGIVHDTEGAGAKIVTGGTHEGLFYRPTVLAQVTPEMRAFDEEIFGPVAPVTTFASDDEAIELANRTHYGLSAAVQTGTLNRGLALADRIKSGAVHVNDQTVNDQANTPFGGTGASGNGGRFGGSSNVDEFTQWQVVTVRDEPITYPF